jgi:hypothetical protein
MHLKMNVASDLLHSNTCGFVYGDIDQVDKKSNAQNPEWCNCEQNWGQENSIEDGEDGESEADEEFSGSLRPQFLFVIKHCRHH